MPYTYTDPVRDVHIIYSVQRPDTIFFEYLSDPVAMTWTRVNADYDPVNPSGDLQQLRQAHNAPGGLVDNTGAAVVPSVGIPNTTYAQLAERGYIDPLDPQGYEKWETSRKFVGTFLEHGTHEVSAGQETLKLEAGFEVHPSQASGQSVTLNDWMVNNGQVANNPYTSPASMTSQFDLRLLIPEFNQVTYAQLHNYGPLAALIVNLNSRRTDPTNMSALTGETSDDAVDPFGDPHVHRFSVDDDDDMELFQFTITGTSASYNSAGTYVTEFRIQAQVIGTGYDFNALQESFTGSETVAGEAEVHNAFGNRATPVTGLKMILSDRAQLDALGGTPRFIVTDDGSNVRHIIPVGYRRVIDFDDLGAVMLNGAEIYRQMPTSENFPLFRELHHYGTTNKVFRLLNPEAANEYTGTARPITIDNQGTGNLEVHDWGGNNIVTLRPDESCDLRFVYDREGNSRLLGEVPERYFSAAAGTVGTLNDYGYYDFDANHWARPIRLPNANDLNIDTDAFTIGTITNINASAVPTWGATAVQRSRDTFEVLKDGTLDFSQSVLYTLVGSGNLGTSTTTRVYLLRNGVLTLIDEIAYDSVAGAGTTRSWRWGFRRRVEAGDVIIPLLVYPKGTTLNVAAGTITDFIRTVTLDQDVAIEYEAS